MNIAEDSYLKSYNQICDFFNDDNIYNLTNMNFKELLNYKQFKEFINEYYNSEESIDNVLIKYNIDERFKRWANKMLPSFESDLICEYCNSKMVYSEKSKTAYKQNFKRSYNLCPNCNHKIISDKSNLCDCNICKEDREKKYQNANNLKLNKLKQIVEESEKYKYTLKTFRFMPLENKTYLLTFLMYLYNETNYALGHSFTRIELLKGINFAPTMNFGFDIITELLGSNLIKFEINQNNLDRIEFKYENPNNFTFTPYKNDYLLNIKSHELFSFTNIVKECETIATTFIEEKQEILEDALTLWKKIGLEELKEYTYYLFKKYNFSEDYIGDSITEKLELILEDFSVSQGYAILYSSISSAASYKQTGITNKHAVNSINTYISNHIAKRKSGEWESKGYKRNFDLPQTAVSLVFFNYILKIGNKGFEQVPKIENIPNNFVDFIDDEKANNVSNLQNEKAKLNENILADLEILLNQFSFMDIIKSLNKDLNISENTIDFYGDNDILEKLKKYIATEKLSL
ncbi:hypothetical protein [Aliarcobacter butzleri]|uniref:hypothetical protein n=1 Tax=Aliarcobacter butzleri TaxID=28197 RepID=UPI00263C11FE|nr:hypothetical protein [Aliarcobacter butzleri]MDN5054337.1 hypothetical protein [Aliarcobacter butzleri]